MVPLSIIRGSCYYCVMLPVEIYNERHEIIGVLNDSSRLSIKVSETANLIPKWIQKLEFGLRQSLGVGVSKTTPYYLYWVILDPSTARAFTQVQNQFLSSLGYKFSLMDTNFVTYVNIENIISKRKATPSTQLLHLDNFIQLNLSVDKSGITILVSGSEEVYANSTNCCSCTLI